MQANKDFSSKLLIRTLDSVKGPVFFLLGFAWGFTLSVLRSPVINRLTTRFKAPHHSALRPVLAVVILLQVIVLTGSCSTTSVSADNGGRTALSPAQKQARAAMEDDLLAGRRSLTDLAALEVTLLFDRPQLIRHEAGNTVYHFTSGPCAADIYFRGVDPSTDDYIAAKATAAYADIRTVTPTGHDSAQSPLNAQDCLRRLLDGAYAPPMPKTAAQDRDTNKAG